MNTGKIVQIIGAVVDVDFSQAQMPAIYNALTVDYEIDGKPTQLVLEVEQHLPDGWVRTVAMSTTDGLKRGMEVIDTSAPISVPVGPKVLGRIFHIEYEELSQNQSSPELKTFQVFSFDPCRHLFIKLIRHAVSPSVVYPVSGFDDLYRLTCCS